MARQKLSSVVPILLLIGVIIIQGQLVVETNDWAGCVEDNHEIQFLNRCYQWYLLDQVSNDEIKNIESIHCKDSMHSMDAWPKGTNYSTNTMFLELLKESIVNYMKNSTRKRDIVNYPLILSEHSPILDHFGGTQKSLEKLNQDSCYKWLYNFLTAKVEHEHCEKIVERSATIVCSREPKILKENQFKQRFSMERIKRQIITESKTDVDYALEDETSISTTPSTQKHQHLNTAELNVRSYSSKVTCPTVTLLLLSVILHLIYA